MTKQNSRLRKLRIVGIILASGPIWGVVGNVVALVLVFWNLRQPQPQVAALAHNISLALYTTVAGVIACPIGIAIIVVSSSKLGIIGEMLNHASQTSSEAILDTDPSAREY